MSLFWSNRSKMVHDSVWFIWTVHSLIESFEVVSHIMAYRILDGWLGYLPTIWCLLLLRSETQPEKESQIITQPVVSWTTNQQKSYYIKSKFLSLFWHFLGCEPWVFPCVVTRGIFTSEIPLCTSEVLLLNSCLTMEITVYWPENNLLW